MNPCPGRCLKQRSSAACRSSPSEDGSCARTRLCNSRAATSAGLRCIVWALSISFRPKKVFPRTDIHLSPRSPRPPLPPLAMAALEVPLGMSAKLHLGPNFTQERVQLLEVDEARRCATLR